MTRGEAVTSTDVTSTVVTSTVVTGTVAELLDARAAADPDRAAVVFASPGTLSMRR